MSNILLINKPEGITSYDVIRYLKQNFGVKKIGHAGTLDPAASGLLIILIDDATKRFDEFQKYPKEYIATVEFGKTTDTYDSEGKITFIYDKPFKLNRSELDNVLKNFVGEIEQSPPAFSAVKISGKPAYKLARAGKQFETKPKKVTVYETEILDIRDKQITIRFVVSSGTYIRSLAFDLGKKLGYGAFLSDLVRAKIGPYKLDDAQNLKDLTIKDLN